MRANFARVGSRLYSNGRVFGSKLKEDGLSDMTRFVSSEAFDLVRVNSSEDKDVTHLHIVGKQDLSVDNWAIQMVLENLVKRFPELSYLEGRNLQFEDLSFLRHAPKLRSLVMEGTRSLSDDVCATSTILPTLKSLSVDNCAIKKPEEWLGKCQLELLAIDINDFDNERFNALWASLPPSVRHLSLKADQLDGKIQEVPTNNTLETLDLADINLSFGDRVKFLVAMRGLKEVHDVDTKGQNVCWKQAEYKAGLEQLAFAADSKLKGGLGTKIRVSQGQESNGGYREMLVLHSLLKASEVENSSALGV